MTPADTGWDFPVFLDWVYPNSGFRLEYQDGTPWPVDESMIYSQTWYSVNGNFMAIWHNDGYFVYIDLTTLAIKAIRVDGDGYASLAISDSGRYVAVNIYGKRGLQLLDVEDCFGASGGYVSSEPVSCPSRQFTDEYTQTGPTEAYGVMPVFYGDDLLGLYIEHNTNEYREYVLRAPNTQQRSNYLALGDSYSSGEGAYHYIKGTDEPNNRCHLSEKSYPYRLASVIKLDSMHSVACSAARMHNIFGTNSARAAQNKKPSDDSVLGKWLPGYKWQLDYLVDDNNPLSIVTVGIGGNDIGFSNKVLKCVMAGDCYDTVVEKYEVAEEISNKFDDLAELYGKIRKETLEGAALGVR